MARDILSEFGKDSPNKQVAPATSGGCTEAKPLPYSPPKGPTSQMQQGSGLHGTVHDCGTQGKH